VTDKLNLTVITDQEDHTEFYAWLKQGKERGWCSEEVCSTHDLLPLEQWEEAFVEDGFDLCQTAVRLYGPYAPDQPATERIFTLHTNND
jgi:hypothetical protein